MLRCHWRTRGRRTYCAEIESRSDIRDMQSLGNVLHSKISYGIGIFGTENRDDGAKCGITELLNTLTSSRMIYMGDG